MRTRKESQGILSCLSLSILKCLDLFAHPPMSHGVGEVVYKIALTQMLGLAIIH